MLVLNGKNRIRDLLDTDLHEGGLGVLGTAEAESDTGLFGGGTTVDDCDAVAGWANAGIGSPEVFNNNAGEFKEGLGCLNLPSGAGVPAVASWNKNVGATDMSNKYLYVIYYVDYKDDLTDASDAVYIDLGTGGLVNYNRYEFDRDTMINNGWTWLKCDVENPDSTGGVGATTNNITHVNIGVQLDAQQLLNDMRMDWWHTLEAGTFGVTATQIAVTTITSDKHISVDYAVPSTSGEGYKYQEYGLTVNAGATLLNRKTYAPLLKNYMEEFVFATDLYIE